MLSLDGGRLLGSRAYRTGTSSVDGAGKNSLLGCFGIQSPLGVSVPATLQNLDSGSDMRIIAVIVLPGVTPGLEALKLVVAGTLIATGKLGCECGASDTRLANNRYG